MYSILQSQAKRHILNNIDRAESYILDKPNTSYIIYANDTIFSLDFMIRSGFIKCSGIELISQILQIYGVYIWHTDNYYYKDYSNNDKVLKCEIKEKCIFHINDICLYSTNCNKMLLLLLTDPLKCIKLCNFEDPKIKDLFDTLQHTIQQKESTAIIKYWLISCFYIGCPLVEDVSNIILTKYIQLLF